MRRSLAPLFMMVLCGTALCWTAPCRTALAQEDPRRAGVVAATDSAVRRLLAEVEAEPISPDVTIKNFLDRTHGTPALVDELGRADQIGGPRWLDEGTCQVRLQASGAAVSAALVKVAADHPRETPFPPADLDRRLAPLRSRVFTATGTSSAAAAVPRPPAYSPWESVPPEQRKQAIENAARAAGEAVLAGVEPVELAGGKTVRDALAIEPVRRAVTDWLATRPVTSVDYLSDDPKSLEVEVALSAHPGDLFDVFRAAVTARPEIPRPDEAGWARVRDEFRRRMAPAVGRAAPPAPAPLALPPQPPDWAGGMVDVVGQGQRQGSSLRAARAAEANALDHLREQVGDLRLVPGETIGEGARRDPRFARSVDHAVARGARLYRVEYRPDGSVLARVSLDLRQFWAAIQDMP